MPTENDDYSMMVPVEEDDWPLSKHEEECVTEFGNFGEGEETGPEGGWTTGIHGETD